MAASGQRKDFRKRARKRRDCRREGGQDCCRGRTRKQREDRCWRDPRPDDSGCGVQQIDQPTTGLSGGRHGFFCKCKRRVLSAKLQFAIDVEIPGPATDTGSSIAACSAAVWAGRTFELDPDQLVAIPEKCLSHLPRRVLIVEQVALTKLILNCPSVRYYPNDNSAIEPHA